VLVVGAVPRPRWRSFLTALPKPLSWFLVLGKGRREREREVEEKMERGMDGKETGRKGRNGEDEDTRKFGNKSIPSMNMEISAICECCHCRQSSNLSHW